MIIKHSLVKSNIKIFVFQTIIHLTPLMSNNSLESKNIEWRNKQTANDILSNLRLQEKNL